MIATHILRNILWHLIFYADYSNRYIASLIRCSHPLVGTIRVKLAELELTWLVIKQMTNDELRAAFYPNLSHRKSNKIDPDYAEVCRQLQLPRKKRKSLSLLYIEYRVKYGERAYGRTIFYERVKAYLKNSNASMSQFYQPGEIMFIDFLGSKVTFQKDGKKSYLPVFVACLGFSKMSFAFATRDMKSESWIQGIIKAFEYFGGVTEVVLFDNAKAMVTKPKLLAVLNENARAFSEYYGCICDTSRVGTPKDNANAENVAKIVTGQIIAPMNQDMTFFSIDEVNEYLIKKIDLLNNRQFQKYDYSRADLFNDKEKLALRSLPSQAYKPYINVKTCRVPSTYFIEHEQHRYSVPYRLVGKNVRVRITYDEIIVVHENTEVARHQLSDEKGGVTRLFEHMKPSHQFESQKTKSGFMAWAKDIGPEVEMVVERQYANTSNRKSRVIGKQCIAIQKLQKAYGEQEFLEACRYVAERNNDDYFTPQYIEMIAKAQAYKSSNAISINGGGYEH